VVVACGPDGKRYTFAGAIDNVLQSLDSTIESAEMMWHVKVAPDKKKRSLEVSSSEEEEESMSDEEDEKPKKKSGTKKKEVKKSKGGGGGRSMTQFFKAQGYSIPMRGGNPKKEARRNFRHGIRSTSKCIRRHSMKSVKKSQKSKRSKVESSDSN